jgi:hypothetical protein
MYCLTSYDFQRTENQIREIVRWERKERRKTITAEETTEPTSNLTETVQRILQDYGSQGVMKPENFGERFKSKVITAGPHVLSKVSKVKKLSIKINNYSIYKGIISLRCFTRESTNIK